jgi:hypothetical protein
MTIYAATERMWLAVHQLRDDMLALRLQAVEDRPRGEPNKLVERVGTVGDTLAGWAEEALEASANAVAATDYPLDGSRFRRALDGCTERVERLGAQFFDELAATTRIDELSELASEGGPELAAWVDAIKQGTDRAHQSLRNVQTALTSCWRELAERAVPNPGPEPADTARRR